MRNPSFFKLRLEKLKNVIRKTYSKFGKLVNEHYPLDSEGKTKGRRNTSGFFVFYLVSSSLVW